MTALARGALPAALVALAAAGCAARQAPAPRVTLDEPGCPAEPDPTALASVQQAIADARRAGRSPVAIFDLDGTLLDPTPRTLRILAAGLSEHDRPDAVAARRHLEALASLTPPPGLPFRVEDVAARLALPADLVPALVERWRREFFTSRWLPLDVPIPGAGEFVAGLHAAGVRIVYLTGRGAAMEEGTVASLRARGFPLESVGSRSAAQLWMKPACRDPGCVPPSDRAFKTAAFEAIAGPAEAVVAVAENEPGNLADLAARFPDAVALFVVSSHSPGAPPVPGGARCIVGFR